MSYSHRNLWNDESWVCAFIRIRTNKLMGDYPGPVHRSSFSITQKRNPADKHTEQQTSSTGRGNYMKALIDIQEQKNDARKCTVSLFSMTEVTTWQNYGWVKTWREKHSSIVTAGEKQHSLTIWMCLGAREATH